MKVDWWDERREEKTIQEEWRAEATRRQRRGGLRPQATPIQLNQLNLI